MSVKAQKAVVDFLSAGGGDAFDLSPSCVSVLRLIGWFASENDGRAWPCENTLTYLSGLSLRGVRNALNGIVSAGLVRREIRKTRDGNGWYYTLSLPSTVGAMVAPSSVSRGNGCRPVGAKNKSRTGNGCRTVGAMVAPDKEEITKISECESEAAHALGVVDNSVSSPFGIYDVEDAVRRLAVGDAPVPRWYIEARALTLTNEGGVTANGTEVTERSFVAHCHTWWKNERNRDEVTLRQGRTHSRFSEQGGIPRATKGEDQKAQLCDECGCIYCVDGHTCTKGYVPPDMRDNACRPDEKLSEGRYRCGCFSLRGGVS